MNKSLVNKFKNLVYNFSQQIILKINLQNRSIFTDFNFVPLKIVPDIFWFYIEFPCNLEED